MVRVMIRVIVMVMGIARMSKTTIRTAIRQKSY